MKGLLRQNKDKSWIIGYCEDLNSEDLSKWTVFDLAPESLHKVKTEPWYFNIGNSDIEIDFERVMVPISDHENPNVVAQMMAQIIEPKQKHLYDHPDYVPHTEACELKELGFDNKKCYAYYNLQNQRMYAIDHDLINFRGVNPDHILAPMYHQAFEWFRSKGLDQEIHKGGRPNMYIVFTNQGYIYESNSNEQKLFSYQDAQLAAVRELIKQFRNR